MCEWLNLLTIISSSVSLQPSYTCRSCFVILWPFLVLCSSWTSLDLLAVAVACQPDWLPSGPAGLPLPPFVLSNILKPSLSISKMCIWVCQFWPWRHLSDKSNCTVSPISVFVVVTKAEMATCKLPLNLTPGENSRPRWKHQRCSNCTFITNETIFTKEKKRPSFVPVFILFHTWFGRSLTGVLNWVISQRAMRRNLMPSFTPHGNLVVYKLLS